MTFNAGWSLRLNQESNPMPETTDAVSETTQVKSDLHRYKVRLLHLLSFVPDDKLTWTPSPTAKSALRIAVHCGLTSRFFADVITGKLPEAMPALPEFFGALDQAEQSVTSRDAAIALLEETTAALSDAIDSVNAENIGSLAVSPFGAMPLQFWIQQGGAQYAGHIGQLEYLQTIWGDLDNHFG